MNVWQNLIDSLVVYDTSELNNKKFVRVAYSYDDGYYVKAGITEDKDIYILEQGKIKESGEE